jgi:predicted transcriptional regulator
MDEEVRNLLLRAVRNLMSLEVTLFFHSHPEQPNDLEDLCRRMGSDPAAVAGVLQDLTQAGIVERFQLGEGRYEIYSYTHNPALRSAIGRLSRCYHENPRSRAEIIRHIITTSFRSELKENHTART